MEVMINCKELVVENFADRTLNPDKKDSKPRRVMFDQIWFMDEKTS